MVMLVAAFLLEQNVVSRVAAQWPAEFEGHESEEEKDQTVCDVADDCERISGYCAATLIN